jgi:hypothetical protein
VGFLAGRMCASSSGRRLAKAMRTGGVNARLPGDADFGFWAQGKTTMGWTRKLQSTVRVACRGGCCDE